MRLIGLVALGVMILAAPRSVAQSNEPDALILGTWHGPYWVTFTQPVGEGQGTLTMTVDRKIGPSSYSASVVQEGTVTDEQGVRGPVSSRQTVELSVQGTTVEIRSSNNVRLYLNRT
jgi:hypothetical protein